MRAICTTLVATMLFGVAGPSAGEEPRPGDAKPATGEKLDARERARLHNQMAKKLFNLGLFQEAAEEYEKAYRAKPAPAFLFNLAQCYKRISRKDTIEKAIFYFKSYINNEPETLMRPDIEKEIAKLERELKELSRPPPPFYKRWWFWTAVGVGVAVTGATVGTIIALQPDDMRPVDGTIGNFGTP